MFKDMGLPWDAEVKSAVKAQGKVFESLGCVVEEAEPDFTDANECFVAWRHWSTDLAFGDLLATHGDQLNEYIHWHVEEGPQADRSVSGAGGSESARRCFSGFAGSRTSSTILFCR